VPSGAYGVVKALNQALLRISAQFGSFVEVEIVRR
jgi:hypothetical protein